MRHTSKRMQQFVKCAAIWRTCHIFTAKGAAIQRKAPQSSEKCRNLAKGAKILGLRRFTRRHTAARPSKCSTFGGRNAVHVPPCFQVPPQHVCCILFDVYRILLILIIFWIPKRGGKQFPRGADSFLPPPEKTLLCVYMETDRPT